MFITFPYATENLVNVNKEGIIYWTMMQKVDRKRGDHPVSVTCEEILL